MLRSHSKNIFCLESLWDNDVENRLTVLPILELLRQTNRVEFAHLSCNTREEFEFNLRHAPRRRSYLVLYLAFHGDRNGISLPDESHLSFSELAELMGQRFKGWTIHLGACSAVSGQNDKILEFIEQTGVSMVTGYGRSVDWAESAAMDFLYLSALQRYRNKASFRKHMEATFPDLIRLNDFQIVTG